MYKLIILISIVELLIISILFFAEKKTTNRQIEEISELENKVQELEEKISELENEKNELDSKVSSLTEIANSFYQSLNALSYQSRSRQIYSESSILVRSYATVVFRKSSCDYFILENNYGYIIAEWMGGNDPNEGDRITGNFNSFGTKDFYNQSRDSDCRLWVDDYMLSKESAMEKIRNKCE